MESAIAVILLLVGYASASETAQAAHITADKTEENADLKSEASTWYRYSNYDRNYPNGYSTGYDVSGHGILDETYYRQNGRQNSYGSYDGYFEDKAYGYKDGYSSATGYGGYTGGSGYDGYQSHSKGGYGGYSGNGGLNSYYGYSNPNYAAANHLGYGYYKKSGYGNIYNNGITPSLVTGYRGYSK